MKRPEGWHVPVRREDVPDTGLHLALEADEEVRGRLAVLTGVLGVPQLGITADLTRHGEGLRAAGRVTGRVTQTCVVTLEAIENTVDEPFDVLFVPPDIAGAAPAGPGPKDVDDTREPLVDGAADIGAVATQFFLLGIDPYPRKPGAVFASPAEDRAADSPFASLERLKGRDRER
jgi:Large ribosomal RNA subunit accumulation protein YceD